ncbi:MAG: hypothetical protein WAM66_13060, partial [Acidobacteriaceae bacterium]
GHSASKKYILILKTKDLANVDPTNNGLRTGRPGNGGFAAPVSLVKKVDIDHENKGLRKR